MGMRIKMIMRKREGKVPCLHSVTGFSSKLVFNLAEHHSLWYEHNGIEGMHPVYGMGTMI